MSQSQFKITQTGTGRLGTIVRHGLAELITQTSQTMGIVSRLELQLTWTQKQLHLLSVHPSCLEWRLLCGRNARAKQAAASVVIKHRGLASKLRVFANFYSWL